jgi:prepilin-type N-terminal cleavage/methylation domain-containing protein
MHMPRALARIVTDRAGLACDQRGFTLVEALLAMVIFVIVATGLAGMLASGINSHGLSRERAQAKENALAQIEYIRRKPYDEVGIVGGNPPGTVTVAEANKQIGLNTGAAGNNTGTMVTQITYVNDPTPTSYATAANYKRVTVTVTRNRDSKLLLRSVTYIAPSTRAPYGGINNAIVNATITDYALSTPMTGATVNLGNGPSAPRSDVTDSTGTVTFPTLTPTTGSQYYTVTPSITGYNVFPDDASPNAPSKFTLAPSQTLNTTVRVYKAAQIIVNIPNYTSGGTASAFYVYVGSGRKSQRFTGYGGGNLTINSLNGEPIIPGIQYTVGAMKEVTPGPSRYYVPSTTLTVPSGYPSNLTTAFNVSLGSVIATRSVVVQVRKSGVAVPSTRVDIQGGPSPGYYLTGITNASGNLTFDVPRSTSGDTTTYYTVTAWNAAATGTGQALNVNASSNSTITVNVP